MAAEAAAAACGAAQPGARPCPALVRWQKPVAAEPHCQPGHRQESPSTLITAPMARRPCGGSADAGFPPSSLVRRRAAGPDQSNPTQQASPLAPACNTPSPCHGKRHGRARPANAVERATKRKMSAQVASHAARQDALTDSCKMRCLKHLHGALPQTAYLHPRRLTH